MDETTQIEAPVELTQTTTEPQAAEATKPGSMLEAMFPAAKPADTAAQPLDANGQPRDPLGRFAPKAAEQASAAVPAVPGAPAAAVPAKAAQPSADALAMPEGLTPKAQERFQYLANTNKELTARVAEIEPQVNYVRETFQKHGIQQEQFEQAATVLGMMNSGDFAGARDALIEQLRLVSLAIGEPAPQVDALSAHPDLRQAVDGLQITEAHAIELARARMTQQAGAQRIEQQRATQQQEAGAQQQFQAGIQAVESLGRRLASTDLDWPRIEAILQPEIQNICRSVPPAQWAATIEAQYRLLKQVAGANRQPASGGGNVLRPTGQASPAARPQSTYEAMFGTPRPSV